MNVQTAIKMTVAEAEVQLIAGIVQSITSAPDVISALKNTVKNLLSESSIKSAIMDIAAQAFEDAGMEQ